MQKIIRSGGKISSESFSFLRKLFIKFCLESNGAIFYINGADTLPSPLTVDEEHSLLNRFYNCDDPEKTEIRNILIERNLRLVVFIAKKFENTGIGLEDLISIGTIGLIKGINTFRTDKNIKLATYASRCIENEILMYIRKNNGVRQELSIDEPLNVDWDGNELLLSDILDNDDDPISDALEKDEDKKILSAALMHLTERERTIIRLRFGLREDGHFDGDGKEKTQKEVADLLGISQSYISRLEKKIMQRLKREMVRFEI
ncbi:MAG: RNA polymerase sporulation sigma factor SigE [Clostridia bacterium]|nr:RNA polymerase sporulation sigma factor SigE [Clostridia bacterium]